MAHSNLTAKAVGSIFPQNSSYAACAGGATHLRKTVPRADHLRREAGQQHSNHAVSAAATPRTFHKDAGHLQHPCSSQHR